MNIATKQFQILTDINLVWDFLWIYMREAMEVYRLRFLNMQFNPHGWILLINTWIDYGLMEIGLWDLYLMNLL